MVAAAIGILSPRNEIGVGQAAMQFLVEPAHIPAHALEGEAHTLRRSFGVVGEIQEYRVKEVRWVLRPVNAQPVQVRILLNDVSDQRMFVSQDVRAGQTTVLG